MTEDMIALISVLITFIFIVAAIKNPSILGKLFLWMLYPIIKPFQKAAEDVRKESLSKIDFQRDADLYRDILKEYSIASLSYIDDFQMKTKREISATLMSLYLKKKIVIEENGITVLDYNLDNLKRSEAYIIKNIEDGKVKLEDENGFLREVQQEAVEDGLIEKLTAKTKKERMIKKAKKKIINAVLLFGGFAIFCQNVEKLNDLSDGVAITIVLAVMILLMYGFKKLFGFGGLSIFAYFVMQSIAYQRTAKGEEINEKIEGLKQYIKNYSMLSQAEKEVLEIWEEYLLYSIIFDLNKTGTVEKLFELINIKYETGKVYFEPANRQ